MLDRHLPRIVNDSEQAPALPKSPLFFERFFFPICHPERSAAGML
jgi:hypothetical protein